MACKKIISGGLFVTFEGPEGSGKSTQISLLKKHFEEQGYLVKLTREPGGTPISEKIRQLLLDPSNTAMIPVTELLLYAASRTQHLGEVIVPHLREGYLVLCDRFHDSTTAYQGYARGLDLSLIKAVHEISLHGILPELTFILMVDVVVGIDRARQESECNGKMKGGDRLEQENLDFHRRVASGYQMIASENPDRVMLVKPGRIEETNRILLSEIEKRLKEKL
ncbi:MAG: dTMP kinase [Candidatus Wallbacteria bacterium]|nr:dTMP kinase [Candidatus Wallbacteria bacterium]